ncbi:hypothetical protein K470DRAFT_240545 [Piedraia hortae CBS 480.64]|uniref:Cyclin N-terminal domain-containing protein n=1 Tax=Piedraia hortae CBS 480.64 TaxID=1314780 RepID=A0A6A7C810_9PEZI|nr:hypothetical protein K470DRAFT_240545 [Piedraia hortae CBS 480.64]
MNQAVASHFRAHPMQFPLTPPNSGVSRYSNMPYGAQNQAVPYHQRYHHPQQLGLGGTRVGNTLPPIRTYNSYDAVPTMLPSLRIDDCKQYEREEPSREAESQGKTGGVAAKLDYEMPMMVTFVIDAVQSLLHRAANDQNAFRKWLHQLLTATRLPLATILLGLHYLDERVQRFPMTISRDDSAMCQLLVVAVLLGSKCLDDSTFINRSWADVSSIPLANINAHEVEWLNLLNYRLHVDLTTSESLRGWFAAWKRFQMAPVEPTRLSPIDMYYRQPDRMVYAAPPVAPYCHQHPIIGVAAPQPYVPYRPYESPADAAPPSYSGQCRPAAYSKTSPTFKKTPDEASDRFPSNVMAFEPETKRTHVTALTPSSFRTGERQWGPAHRSDCSCLSCLQLNKRYSMPLGSTMAVAV